MSNRYSLTSTLHNLFWLFLCSFASLFAFTILLAYCAAFAPIPVHSSAPLLHAGPELLPVPTPGVPNSLRLFLPLVAHHAKLDSGSNNSIEVPPGIVASSDSVADAVIPVADEHTFVATTGGDLDSYLGRRDLNDGKLHFTINVSSPVVIGSADANGGFLSDADWERLIAERKLASSVQILLRVFDIDHEADGCPEENHLWINNQLVKDSMDRPVRLTSGNGNWVTWSILVPSNLIRFPYQQSANSGAVTPVPNDIAIEIDTNYCLNWKMTVDWGVIQTNPSLNYGLFFVHGWTGAANTFGDFYEWQYVKALPHINLNSTLMG